MTTTTTTGRVSALVHCPACQVVSELTAHRDATAGAWSVRRATLNFALVVARRACPEYRPVRGEAEEA